MKSKESKEHEKIEERKLAVLKGIVERRNELGISQMDLALLIGMSFNGYFKVETGKTKLDTERLFLLLEKLNISPKNFFKKIE